MKINLTKGEAKALFNTAENMRDDLDYFKFLGKAKHRKFCKDYETGMEKLLSVIRCEIKKGL